MNRATKIERVRSVLRIAGALDCCDGDVADNLLHTLVTRAQPADNSAMLRAALAVISDDGLDMLVALAEYEHQSMREYLAEAGTEQERSAADVALRGAA